MGCNHLPAGHWVGVVTLLIGLGLSVAGVASPTWRMVDIQGRTVYEGLWQHCDMLRPSTGQPTCVFSPRNFGLWRAIQVIKVVALLSLLCAFGFSLVVPKVRPRRAPKLGHHRRCPTSAAAALLGGVLGLVADLMYVGYMERHATGLEAGEQTYAWSFALAIAGSLFSLMASFIIYGSAKCCSPRYVSHTIEPYFPYAQFSVSGHPKPDRGHYVPYTLPSLVLPTLDRERLGGQGPSVADSRTKRAPAALDRRREFEHRGRWEGFGIRLEPGSDFFYHCPPSRQHFSSPEPLPPPTHHDYHQLQQFHLPRVVVSRAMGPDVPYRSRLATDVNLLQTTNTSVELYPEPCMQDLSQGYIRIRQVADEEGVDQIVSGNLAQQKPPRTEPTGLQERAAGDVAEAPEMQAQGPIKPPRARRRSKSAQSAGRETTTENPYKSWRDSGLGTSTLAPAPSRSQSAPPVVAARASGKSVCASDQDGGVRYKHVRKGEERTVRTTVTRQPEGGVGKNDARSLSSFDLPAAPRLSYSARDLTSHAQQQQQQHLLQQPALSSNPPPTQRLAWRRRSSMPESLSLPASNLLLLQGRRPGPPLHGPWYVWLRNPRQEKVVIKTRRGRFEL